MHWQPSDDLDRITLGTAEEERRRAKNWMDTAAQHSRNEAYWRVRALKAEGATLSPDDAALLEVMDKPPLSVREGDQVVDERVREVLDASMLARGKILFEAYGQELPTHLPEGHKDDWELLPKNQKNSWARIATAVARSLTPDW